MRFSNSRSSAKISTSSSRSSFNILAPGVPGRERLEEISDPSVTNDGHDDEGWLNIESSYTST